MCRNKLSWSAYFGSKMLIQLNSFPMSLSSSICIKILSLAVVFWAVTSSNSLIVQSATWVPWMVLLLLMLLEAYAVDAKPASWSQWSAGLLRMVGPSMLPYYALLAAFLAFGPGQVRHIPQAGVPVYSGPPISRPGGFPNQYPGGQHTPGRPTGFPGNTAPPRPTSANPAAAKGQPGASATGAPPRPAPFPGNAANGGAVRTPIQPATGATAPANGAPASTGKPPGTPAK